MHTKIKLDKNIPKIRKKAIILHISSPASHETVAAHPISKGIVRNVTYEKNIVTHINESSTSNVNIFITHKSAYFYRIIDMFLLVIINYHTTCFPRIPI